MIYLHDGLFDGFLTCIYEHYYTENAVGIYMEHNYRPQLFEETRKIPTDTEKARKVQEAIRSKLTDEAYHDVFYAFSSNDPNKDCYLLNYLILGFKLGRDINKLHTHPVSHPVKRLSKRVGMERHKFLGLLRFMDSGSCLYAPFEPDNDLLALLADHFADRFANERFIIHDLGRNRAVVCQKRKWMLTDLVLDERIVESEKEMFFQKLWKNYFDSVGIESRKNLKLQQNFVPLKYRKHTTEFKNE